MRTLLLADDSVTIQRVIELTFSGEDIQVIAVNDGEQAIARIPVEQPDVVLADIGMPRTGGYDVAAFVKGCPDLSHIPVLLLAGAFEPVDQTRAEQAGADGVLIKPFEPRQVIERVKELLAAFRPTISAEVVPEPPAPGEAAAPPVQSLDDLFESLNQALTEHATSWPMEKEQRIPAMRDGSHAPNDRDGASLDSTSCHDASLDSVPFSAARSPSTPAATLDDYFDRLSTAFSHARAADPFETLPDPIEDSGHAMTSGPPAASHEWLGPATNTVAHGHASPSPEIVDIVTERVIARLVPELTESLRRLVRQEIARTR